MDIVDKDLASFALDIILLSAAAVGVIAFVRYWIEEWNYVRWKKSLRR